MIELYAVVDAAGEVRGYGDSPDEPEAWADAYDRAHPECIGRDAPDGWRAARIAEGWRCLPGYTVVERRVVEEHARMVEAAWREGYREGVVERLSEGEDSREREDHEWSISTARAALSPAPGGEEGT